MVGSARRWRYCRSLGDGSDVWDEENICPHGRRRGREDADHPEIRQLWVWVLKGGRPRGRVDGGLTIQVTRHSSTRRREEPAYLSVVSMVPLRDG